MWLVSILEIIVVSRFFNVLYRNIKVFATALYCKRIIGDLIQIFKIFHNFDIMSSQAIGRKSIKNLLV